MVVMSSVNTLLMAMFERTREIGTMLAMGTPHSWIVGLLMTEAALLGLLGAAVGIVGGSLGRRASEFPESAPAAPAGAHLGDVVPGAARALAHGRRVAAGHHLAGAGVHSARDPRIADSDYGGTRPCLTSIVFCAGT